MHVPARSLVLVFCITAAFDVLLNLSPHPLGVLLADYFEQHTVLAAAMIAGFIGAFTLPVVASFTDYRAPSIHSIGTTFAVSALIGFPMYFSKFTSNEFPVAGISMDGSQFTLNR